MAQVPGCVSTLMNALCTAIPANQRIVTIEDAAELQIQQPYVTRMETRCANVEGEGEVIARDLVRNALRMRPDRILCSLRWCQEFSPRLPAWRSLARENLQSMAQFWSTIPGKASMRTGNPLENRCCSNPHVRVLRCCRHRVCGHGTSVLSSAAELLSQRWR